MIQRSWAALRLPPPVTRWLATRSPGERRLVALIAAVGVIAVLWALLWQPIVRDARAMREEKEQGRTTLAAARRMGDELAALARESGPPRVPDARASLEGALAQQDLRSAVSQLEWQDGRARLVFAAVGYDALIVWLDALQREAQLRAVEATLTARVEPGMVRAELVLAR